MAKKRVKLLSQENGQIGNLPNESRIKMQFRFCCSVAMIIDDWKGGSLCFPNKAIFMEFCTKYDKNATVTNLFINSVVRSS